MAEKLNVQPREEFGKGAARRIRAEHKIPAVVYGHGMDPVHLVLPGHETALAARNSNALLELTLPDGTAHTVLIKDLQRHPLRRAQYVQSAASPHGRVRRRLQPPTLRHGAAMRKLPRISHPFRRSRKCPRRPKHRHPYPRIPSRHHVPTSTNRGRR